MRPIRLKKPISKNNRLEDQQRSPRVIKAIDFLRIIQEHKWLESEKQGRDIGFENAVKDWLFRFGEKVSIRS